MAARSSTLSTRALLGSLGLTLLVLVWWACTSLPEDELGMVERFAPLTAFKSLQELLLGAELLAHLTVSLRRIAIGLGGALLIGVPLGLIVGSSRVAAWTSAPAFQFLRMISPLSLMPIAVMAFGIGDRPIYLLLSFSALWPILLSTAEGVRALDARWLELGRSLSATRAELVLHVVMPGVLSHLLTGVRLAIGVLWVVLVPCEMLGVSAGLGYYILDTRDRLAYSELMAMIIVIGAIGFLLDGLARVLANALAPIPAED